MHTGEHSNFQLGRNLETEKSTQIRVLDSIWKPHTAHLL